MTRGAERSEGDGSPCNDSPLQRALFSAPRKGRLEANDSSPGDLTAVILAGGASRRMGGRNKAFLELDGRPLIEIVVERMRSVCAEVLIVAGDTSLYAGLGVPVAEDRFRGVGVLGGLHAGLEAAAHELTLTVGCDMPFLNPDLLRAFANWAEGFDATVLCQGEQVEPLHAAYRRICLPAIEAAIRAGERRVVSIFPHVRVRYVTPAEVSSIDPGLRSFRNVNTPREWEAVQAEWARRVEHYPKGC